MSDSVEQLCSAAFQDEDEIASCQETCNLDTADDRKECVSLRLEALGGDDDDDEKDPTQLCAGTMQGGVCITNR